MMARTIDSAVRDLIGNQVLQIMTLQMQVEDLTEQLAEAKRAAEKAPPHRVPRDDREVG